MAKYSPGLECIKCDCGNEIYTDLEHDLRNDVDPDDSLEDSVELECDDCGRRFKLTICVSCTVDVESVDIEEFVELDGIQIAFKEIPVGSTVEVDDGIYCDGVNEYVVENGVLVSVWNATVTDEQLKLAI
ncbi:hypothetical protein ACOALA_03990 [Alicyclobacillus acidoterrestris]|uniref:hypothetical protein n=1 Tax=Alicyclobacillus acidoterrestris TaxID=1450 RepID=UPI003F538AD4